MRRTKTVVMPETAGRDAGRVFIITEMPSKQGFEWGIRAVMAIAHNFELPDNWKDQGLAAVAALGFSSLTKAPWGDVSPLLDELMDCVKIQPDPKQPAVVRDLIDDDIQEIETQLELRKEAFMLHTDFLQAAGRLKSMFGEEVPTGG